MSRFVKNAIIYKINALGIDKSAVIIYRQRGKEAPIL